MRVSAVPSRRTFGLIFGLAAACLLAVALLQGQAEGKPARNCKKGSEKAGCKLPVGAAYSKQVRTGSANGTLRASIIAKGISVSIYSAYIHCNQFDPLIGDEIGVADSYRGNQRPRVGRTYTIKKEESRSSEETGSSNTKSELTLNFKSAKQLVLTLHQVSTADGKLLCDGSKTWTLKRE